MTEPETGAGPDSPGPDSDGPDSEGPESDGPALLAREKAERRRRALELLGELEPSRGSGDTDEGWGETPSGSHDDELRRNVPPHHG